MAPDNIASASARSAFCTPDLPVWQPGRLRSHGQARVIVRIVYRTLFGQGLFPPRLEASRAGQINPIRLCFCKSAPSSCPSPRKHALACLHVLLPHPQAGADGEKGRRNHPQRTFERPLSPWGERQSEGALLLKQPTGLGLMLKRLRYSAAFSAAGASSAASSAAYCASAFLIFAALMWPKPRIASGTAAYCAAAARFALVSFGRSRSMRAS